MQEAKETDRERAIRIIRSAERQTRDAIVYACAIVFCSTDMPLDVVRKAAALI